MSKETTVLEKLPFDLIIIIGAGRSGTNILRDTLTSLDGFETWPCDEINPIWRHGNLLWPDDEIPVDALTPVITNFVRRQFIKLWKSRGKPQFIVEKTCANSLRIPYVHSIFPEARFIHLVRNGYDVAASAEKRWRGEFELPSLRYFFSKARYTPILDLPIYFYRFAKARLKIKSGQSDHLGDWGPRFTGMSDLTEMSLINVCALQWVNCIERANADFAELTNKVVVVKYETLIAEPSWVVRGLLRHVAPEAEILDNVIESATMSIRAAGACKYDSVNPRLDPKVRERMQALMAQIEACKIDISKESRFSVSPASLGVAQ